VCLFFLLSAYLIAELLERERQTIGHVHAAVLNARAESYAYGLCTLHSCSEQSLILNIGDVGVVLFRTVTHGQN
jgi:hypothetical protein